MSGEIYRIGSHDFFHRIMRRTGNLRSLALMSVSLGIIASVLVSSWGFDTAGFRLWVDLVPRVTRKFRKCIS